MSSFETTDQVQKREHDQAHSFDLDGYLAEHTSVNTPNDEDNRLSRTKSTNSHVDQKKKNSILNKTQFRPNDIFKSCKESTYSEEACFDFEVDAHFNRNYFRNFLEIVKAESKDRPNAYLNSLRMGDNINEYYLGSNVDTLDWSNPSDAGIVHLKDILH